MTSKDRVKRAAAAGAIGIATLSLGLSAGPAHAAKLGKSGGFTYMKESGLLQGTGATNSTDVDVACPAGQESTAGGSATTGPPATAYLNTSGKVGERQWYTEGWHASPAAAKVVGWAICTKKKDQVEQGSEPETVDPAPASGTEAAFCEEGSFLTGGGVRAVGDEDDFWINAINPIDGPGDLDSEVDDGFRAWLHHREGGSTTMITDIVCMTGIDPAYRVEFKDTDNEVVKVKATCPGQRVVVGGGAYASGAASAAHVSRSAPIDGDDEGKIPDDGWSVTYFNHTATSHEYRAYAICV
jgi:hypothetical protein